MQINDFRFKTGLVIGAQKSRKSSIVNCKSKLINQSLIFFIPLKKNIMNLQATKKELVKTILNINDVNFIKRVSEFIEENKKNDFWNDLSLNEQLEIKQGIEELNRGERIEYKEFVKKLMK